MDFARKVLGKYGWKDGDGLGKNNDGIAKPLRATLKFDNSGFGADQAASDFNNHWWERVFNDAASNVEVRQEGESIKMDLKCAEDGVEISTKGYSVKKLKKAKANREATSNTPANAYDNFMQAATLTNLGGEVENPDRIEAGDIEVTKVKVLTDEELFKACGGRTAHKGARHGLKLSGKLARLEQQEQELLAKMMAKRNGIAEETESTTNKKSKKEKQDQAEDLPENDLESSTRKKKRKTKSEEVENTPEENLTKEPKKKKRKHCTESSELDDGVAIDIVQICDGNSETNAKKEKKSKRKHADTANTTAEDGDAPKKTKKKKKERNADDIVEEESNLAEENAHKKKKNKKKIKSDQE